MTEATEEGRLSLLGGEEGSDLTGSRLRAILCSTIEAVLEEELEMPFSVV